VATQRLVDLAAAAVPGCESCGITVTSKGAPHTTHASDELTLKFDQRQYDADEGPCVEAARTGQEFRIDAISTETRWPRFSEAAMEAGLGSSLSFPLPIDHTGGAFNLYSRREHAFDDRAIDAARIFALQIAVTLSNVDLLAHVRDMVAQMNIAIESRDLIGQAKGILMEREQIDADEAFDMLRIISQKTNVKLRDIAERVVADLESSEAAQISRIGNPTDN
jgi:GAF domain-containing protein